ncbi:MAG: UDP-glucose 4-epimerase GalE, partial [Oscillospiraceae bacterium]
MAILVTGGAGYIGSHCVARLLADGVDTVVIDNLSKGHRKAVGAARLYVGDLRERSFVQKVFECETIEAVIHFAAFSLVGESVTTPGKYFDNNIAASLSVLDAMVTHGVKYFIFSSTAATYGEPEKTPIFENDRQVPTNPYGESKLCVEKIMRWYGEAYGIGFCALRYFNVAGSLPDGSIGEDHRPETHLIPIVLEVAAGKRSAITVFGTDYPTPDGTCIRDYVHVCDLVDGHVRALAYLRQGGESTAFNLGIGHGFSVLEIIEAARTATGRDIPVKYGMRRAG